MAGFDRFGNVQRLLCEWARWRLQASGADIGYPREAAFRRMMLVKGEANLPAAFLDDDTALSIDRAVGRLKMISQPVQSDYRWQVIMDSYLGGYLDRQIANRLRVSRSTVRTARIAGENWIEGALLTMPVLTEKC